MIQERDKKSPKNVIENIAGRDIDGREIKVSKKSFLPQQLSFFGEFLPSEDDHKYSNTIAFYDSMPKYHFDSRGIKELREANGGKYLDTMVREFEYQNKTNTLIITPARIRTKDGNEREYFPGLREQNVEEALRKLACDQNNAVWLDEEAGVQFSLYQLQKELENTGHSIHIDSLKEALMILNHTIMEVSTKDGKQAMMSAPLFPLVALINRDQYLEDTDSKCLVKFHPLVTASIKKIDYRQFDYERWMKYKTILARYLDKRLSMHFSNAAINKTYNIKLSTVIQGSGIAASQSHSQNDRKMDRAIEELINSNVVCDVKKDIRREGKRITDIKYDFIPTLDFISEMKKSNKRRNQHLEKLSTSKNTYNLNKSKPKQDAIKTASPDDFKQLGAILNKDG